MCPWSFFLIIRQVSHEDHTGKQQVYINFKVKSLEIRPPEPMLKKGGISPTHVGEIGFKKCNEMELRWGSNIGHFVSSAKTPNFIRLDINRRQETEN